MAKSDKRQGSSDNFNDRSQRTSRSKQFNVRLSEEMWDKIDLIHLIYPKMSKNDIAEMIMVAGLDSVIEEADPKRVRAAKLLLKPD